MRDDGTGRLLCGSDACDVCSLGPLLGESRPAWLARLRAHFRGNPIPLTAAEVAAERARARQLARYADLPSRACERCGQKRPINGPCIGCVSRRRRGVA